LDMNDLRVAALHQAAQDEKHYGGQMTSYVSPPDSEKVVARAERYLTFLFGGMPKQSPAPASTKKRRT
jgi:hypothetical protein